MKLAIMQPYIFPYIGYFQLINAVDKFIFYDDVHYIKRGWINRNQLLVNGEAKLFTIPVIKASQNKLINEINHAIDDKWLKQFYSTIEFNYKKAPYFEDTFSLIKQIISCNHTSISSLTIESIKAISNHLDITTVFETSSSKYNETKGMDRADRLITICKLNKAKDYVNPSGGSEIYTKTYFEKDEINLHFIQNELNPYPQFKNIFVSGLSIIDVMMFNPKEKIKEMLNQYKLN